jgi:cytochrome c biogenesis protein CcdA
MDLILGYVAGVLTLINPCVLPILPIVLATALQAGRAGPLALAAGMSLSFVVLGLVVASAGRALGITEATVSNAAALLMIAFGAILLVPRFSTVFATATGGMAGRADQSMDDLESDSIAGQFVGGILLGAVWSPCIGPTLGAAIGLASQGGSLFSAGAIMVAFALGVSSIVLALAYGAQSVIRRRQAALRRLAEVSRPLMGAIFIAVGLAILFKVHHAVEIWALDNLPEWFTALSVSI